ncbi:MAG: type II toxin-antitoxin system HicA family toxin [Alphaproteobacteria bacterium]
MNSAELIRYLKKHGAVQAGGGKGSHQRYRLGERVTIIPVHGRAKELGTGLVRSICKDLGLPPPK